MSQHRRRARGSIYSRDQLVPQCWREERARCAQQLVLCGLCHRALVVRQAGRPGISAAELSTFVCVLVRPVTLCIGQIPSAAPRAVSVSSRVSVAVACGKRGQYAHRSGFPHCF